MIVVIPSNREVRLDYLAPLIDAGCRFIVVDDSEGRVRVDHPSFKVYNWGDRSRILGARDHGIPRRNGACRDFGFYLAWHEAAADEIIIALDDDCEVYHRDFAERAAAALSPRPRPVATVPGVHLNVLDLYREPDPQPHFPRGFPYSARPGYQPCTFLPPTTIAPKFSLGLWRDVYDINAIDKLRGPAYSHPAAEAKHDSVTIAPGRLVSVCSMNMICRREVLPALYQLPMHVPVMPGWVIDRYGDIWGGFILKILMDRRGDALAAGEPFIRHVKEGDFQRNIWQEHVCHLVNDEFIALMRAAGDRIQPAGYVEMMAALNVEFRAATSAASPLLKTYLEHLTPAIDAWVELLSSSV